MVYWKNPLHPPPAPPGFGTGHILPEKSSPWPSRLTIHWLGKFLDVGFSRPLMEDDFWELPPARHADLLADHVEKSFYSRCPPEKRDQDFRDIDSDVLEQDVVGKKEEEKEVRAPTSAKKPVYDESLFAALISTFSTRINLSTLLLIVGDTLRTTTPLVNKVFLTWCTANYVYYNLPDDQRAAAAAAGLNKPQGVGYGIGVAFGIVAMQVSSSLMANHYALAAMTTGLSARSGLIGAIFRKSLRLSGKARVDHTVGQITTMISVDATRVDTFMAFGPHLISSPIQILLAIGLLIWNLGYVTFVGFGVMIIFMPLQYLVVLVIMQQRQKGVKITDKRVRLSTEVLQGIRLIKVYGWERFYIDALMQYRTAEMGTVKASSLATAVLVAMFTVVPILSTILTFIAYSLTGHDLNIAIIFTALQLFNVIRIPLVMLPLVLSSLSDALVSLTRITKFLLAEELANSYTIEPSQKEALHVNGDFEWETVKGLDFTADKEKSVDMVEEAKKLQEEQKMKKEEEKKKKAEEKARKKAEKAVGAGGNSTSGSWWRFGKKTQTVVDVVVPVEDYEKATAEEIVDEDEKPFGLKQLKFDVPKGSFVAIVGRVGSGKSSILQALIGEMKRTNGEVIFGGSVSYVPQVPWIQNATLRDNILFGKSYNEKWYQEVIRVCSLEQDLSMLPHGDQTEIGEKGINLSGGQKARVSLARAVYSSADIVLLDDPLSAVDSYVGKSILDNCLLDGPLASRTRILVTHALHVLDKADHIYVMDNGKIIEDGSYSDLMTSSVVFRRLVEEYGNQDSGKEAPAVERTVQATDVAISKNATLAASPLMELEERNTGAVGWEIYKKYLQSAGGLFWLPLLGGLYLISEAGNVSSTLFLGFWTGRTIPHFKNGHYMAVYGGIGGGVAVASFFTTYAFIILGLAASLNLYRNALKGVLYSPTSFFDTTPMGRISSRLTKDQEVIDNKLAITFMQFISTFMTIFGTIGLVFYTFPYLGIIFAPLAILYYGAGVYYRRSSVEAKRLDSVLRSHLYGSFSETLTGLPTIRAYSKQQASIVDAQRSLDKQNQAYFMTVVMQRWLAIRLDFFGNMLVLGICLFGAATSKSINPSKTSVVLTYTLSITQIFAEIVSLFATCEQDMNAVERVLHYADLPAEGRLHQDNQKPPAAWPDRGEVTFKNVRMAYRPGLPEVLKGVTFNVRPGEKIGIVGRTGSGKSSLIQALLRLVELQNGEIMVDGYDISTVDLDTLRHGIAFVPQDTTVFLGTLRDNLDPHRLRTDVELISVLQRAWLLPKDPASDPQAENKFSLDSLVGDEGSNFSAGEKQLLALARALVKNSRIIVLDEATSSVDVETDAKVQRTIKSEFSTSTLLCIAHRLNTISYYDRIVVMDDGQIAEFDTVLNLFDNTSSIFRSLCEEASLSRADILKLRAEHAVESNS
ncbi:ATP-dependent bile acid permease [Crepidotus variabilis]|uniref:ATP-dependent bile acid permease n=1 Tax=Crepidotus variabilis TaxID=179855 RepID=A0A9P6EDM9_9AGAR|nr:ATP-dependent bile acid permease [Crepidotus variabilis]